jgi:hypothetical protein
MSFVYECGYRTYFEGTRALPVLANYQLVSAGFGGSLLFTNGTDDLVGDADGGTHFVSLGDNNLAVYTNLTTRRWREVRATDGGFLVVRGSMFSDNEPCWMKLVGPDGNVTMLNYVSATGTTNSCIGGRIDSNRQLFTHIVSGANHTVVVRPLNSAGSTTMVYTDLGAQMTSYLTYPPRVFTFWDVESSLVTGP